MRHSDPWAKVPQTPARYGSVLPVASLLPQGMGAESNRNLFDSAPQRTSFSRNLNTRLLPLNLKNYILLLFWERHTVCFDHIQTSSPVSISSLLLSPLQYFILFFVFLLKAISSFLYFPSALGYGPILWSLVSLPCITPIKKTNYPRSSKCQ